MGCSCSTSAIVANANRTDPTKTLTLQRQFEADAVRRFKRIRKDIITSIVTNDVFGLKQDDPMAVPFRNEALPPRAFAFDTDQQKVVKFMQWLEEQVLLEVLGVTLGTPIQSAAQSAWSNVYIESAYNKGLRQSASNMRAQGATIRPEFIDAAFTRPIHADVVGLAATRTFMELQGITQTMDAQISRVLSNGIIEGLGARELAKNITNRVDKIGITRARTLARTEVVAAHAEASLNMYAEAGVEGVEADVEFVTAGDDLVCPECEALEGRIFTVDEARGIIPVHPNCRCAWLPVIPDARSISL